MKKMNKMNWKIQIGGVKRKKLQQNGDVLLQHEWYVILRQGFGPVRSGSDTASFPRWNEGKLFLFG